MVMNGLELVDAYRTRTSAQHHADALNAGRAIVESHRPIGTRVQPARRAVVFCEEAGCPASECVHCQIGAAVDKGHEDEARERFGDATVDDWFRAEWGVDPDAMRDELATDDREFDARREDGR